MKKKARVRVKKSGGVFVSYSIIHNSSDVSNCPKRLDLVKCSYVDNIYLRRSY